MIEPQQQTYRSLPIVNVTSSGMNFSSAACNYIKSDENQFILSRNTEGDVILLPVSDTVNFSNDTYYLFDTKVVPSICIFRAKKEGSESKVNRFTSTAAKSIEEGKYKLVLELPNDELELDYRGRKKDIHRENISIDRTFKLVKVQ